MLPLLFPAAVVAVAANDNVVAIGATLVAAVLAAATVFFAAVISVVSSCCCLLQALLLLLLLLSLVYVLSFAAFRAPKSPPVVWCLHRFGTCTSCLVLGKSTRMCVYVCARAHTIITCVRTSSSAERQAGQREVSIALSKHGRAHRQVTMECTTGAWGLSLRLCDCAEESSMRRKNGTNRSEKRC